MQPSPAQTVIILALIGAFVFLTWQKLGQPEVIVGALVALIGGIWLAITRASRGAS